MSDPSFEAKLINYLLAVISQSSQISSQRKQPDFVPCRIRTGPEMAAYLSCGEHDCETNVWGAIKLTLSDGKTLGVYIHECEILDLRRNVKKQIIEREKREAQS